MTPISSKKTIKDLGIGTVQFGIPYGITNSEGKTPLDEAGRILRYAQEKKVTTLDTAANYGNGEEVLGSLLPTHGPFRIVTKSANIPYIKSVQSAYDFLRGSIGASLTKLGLKKIYGFLLHETEAFLSSQGEFLFEALKKIQAEGLVEKVGASVYHPHQAEAMLERFQFDLIQLPTNVIDQRFLACGVLDRLKARNVEIHVRSIFLQGVLLSPLEKLPSFLSPLHPTLLRFHSFLNKNKISSLEASIDFIKKVTAIDVVLVGVNSLPQFINIAEAFYSAETTLGLEEYATFASLELGLIDPSQWPSKKAA